MIRSFFKERTTAFLLSFSCAILLKLVNLYKAVGLVSNHIFIGIAVR